MLVCLQHFEFSFVFLWDEKMRCFFYKKTSLTRRWDCAFFFQGMCFSMSVIVSGLNWIRGVCPSVCLLPVYRCEFAYCQCWSALCHRLWQSQQPRERVFGIFWMTGCWKIQFTWTFQLSERHTRVGINSFLALLIRLFFLLLFRYHFESPAVCRVLFVTLLRI